MDEPSPRPASNVRAVLFDFDGTLGDSYPAITASVNHVRERHGLPPLSEQDVRPHVGRGPQHLLSHTVPAGSFGANLAAYRAHHPSVLRSGTTLLPGATETLAALHARGLKLGICSNKPVGFTRTLADYLHIASFFDLILGPEDVPRPKPAPDMLRAALARLHLPAEQTLYIGDMIVDIQTARGAGVPVWVVPTGSEELAALEQAKPDRVLQNMDELRTLLAPS